MAEFFKINIYAMLCGFVIDLIIGDPEGWPHPVIYVGKYISFVEKRIRNSSKSSEETRRKAVFLGISTVLVTMAITAALLFAVGLLGRAAQFILMSIISWTCLSAKCLAVEGRGVAKALGVSLEAGRKQVARIVGRDTQSLSEDEILAATVETVAENTTDGVIAPMLYLALGGPILGMGFKAASTLDSMVGYLDEKFRDIGWYSAKQDDVLNYIPARLCGFLMSIGAFLGGMDSKNALKIMKRDHANHLSPNCAWSEAAAAGAMHIQLGGTHTYFGKVVEKPTIGDKDREIRTEDVNNTIKLMYISAGFTALIALLIAVIL